MAAAYIAASPGNGPAAGATETKVFRFHGNQEAKNLLLPRKVLTNLRAPIESFGNEIRGKPLASPDGFLRPGKLRFSDLRNG